MMDRGLYEGLTDAQVEQLMKPLTEEIERRKQQKQQPKDLLKREFRPRAEYYYITDSDNDVVIIYPEPGLNNAFSHFNLYPCDEYTREEVERIALQLRVFRKMLFVVKRLGDVACFRTPNLCYRQNDEKIEALYDFFTEEERKAFEV